MSLRPPISIPPAPLAPSRSDPATFEARNDAAVEYQFTVLPSALNSVNETVFENATAAQASAQQSLSNAHFKGRWSGLSGELKVPASVYHEGQYWQLLDSLENVQASEPSEGNPNWVVSLVRVAEAFEIGDYRDSLRPMSDAYLRRDGSMYKIEDYPTLASFFDPVPPGYQWEFIEVNGVYDVHGVIRVGSDFYAITSDGTDTSIYRSITNGASFEFIVSVSNISGLSMAHDPETGKFVMTGKDRKVAVSDDGINWGVPFVVAQIPASPEQGIRSVIHHNGAFIAVSSTRDHTTAGTGRVIKSVDGGLTWTVVYTSPNYSSAVTYGLTVVSVNDRVYYSGANGSGFIWAVSNEAVTSFTLQSQGRVDVSVSAVYTDKYIAVQVTGGYGSSPNLVTSETGTSWELAQKLEMVDGIPARFVYANDKLTLFIGTNTVLFSDANGLEWQRSTVEGADFAIGRELYTQAAISEDGSVVLMPSKTGKILRGVDIPQAHFRVPEDNPRGGWIKAKAD